MNLLVVDDNPDDFFVIRNALSGLPDLKLRHCENGNEALEALRQQTPDGILLDYRLSDIDGLSLLLAMQREHGPGLPPVIVISGYTDPRLEESFLRAGADLWVNKDQMEPVALREALRELVG